MATVKSEYYRLNGASWDLYYFKTSADLVAETKDYKVLTAEERTKIDENLTTFNVANKLVKLGADAKLPSAIIPDSGNYLPIVGGALTGDTRKITNVLAIKGGSGDEVGLDLAGNRASLQAGNSNVLSVEYISQSGKRVVKAHNNRITDLGNPEAGSDAVSKAWVESLVAQGTHAVGAVRAASTTDGGTLAGNKNIDGVALVPEDRVLLKDQDIPGENGVYIVKAGTWVKVPNDSDKGSLTFVLEGTNNKGRQYYNRDGSTWEIFTVQGSYHATTDGGLELDSSGLGFKVAEEGITNAMLAGAISWDKMKLFEGPGPITDGASIPWSSYAQAFENEASLNLKIKKILEFMQLMRGTTNLLTDNTQTISDAYANIKLKNRTDSGTLLPPSNESYVTGDVYLKELSRT